MEQTAGPYWLVATVYAKLFLDRNVYWTLQVGKHKANKNMQNSQRTFVIRTPLSTHTINRKD